MDNIRTYAFGDNFIKKTAEYILENAEDKNDLSRIVCVFSNKRPALFLNRELSSKIERDFFPPRVFVFDEFIEYVLSKSEQFSRISSTEAGYAIYKLVKDIDPDLLKGRESFSAFFPWARQIYSFIEHLDLEDVDQDALEGVNKSAAIGYDVPESVNKLLLNIKEIRSNLHEMMDVKKMYSRGYQYLKAIKTADGLDTPEFKKILFCNFFYLQKTEKRIVKSLYEKGKAVLLFQGDQDKWPVLKENADYFNCDIKPQDEITIDNNINIYSASDSHSEAAAAAQIIKNIKKHDRTVIVLPDAASSLPLLSEISSEVKDFNVSVGYPLKRSSLYVLLRSIFEAQRTAKGGKYYTKDYLTVMMHPLAKNIKLLTKRDHTRILVHKIEESLKGFEKNRLSGSLFVDLKEIVQENKIFSLAKEMAGDPEAGIEDLRSCLKGLHGILFKKWEDVNSLSGFASVLYEFTDIMSKSSILGCYPLNYSVAQKLFDCADMLNNCSFAGERFEKEEIFRIFEDIMESKTVDFSGSPLKGLQVLGLYKTHSLNFDEVIVLDVNEGVLPGTGLVQPLIPREVMLSLGLSRIGREDEIARYQFMRLISNAKNVHLIYKSDDKSARSRFVEELIWEKEKEEEKLDVVKVNRAVIPALYQQAKQPEEKTPEMVEHLKSLTFSHTSVNTYIECPKKFYFRYVLGLKEKDSLLSDIEAADIGNFVHELLETAFNNFKGQEPVIDRKFRKYFLALSNSKFESFFSRKMASDSFLLKELLKNKLEAFLSFEKGRGVKKVLHLEEKVFGDIGGFKFTAKIDRIDGMPDGTILVIDYKTGEIENLPSKKEDQLKDLSDRTSIKKAVKSFQLPIYLYLAEKEYDLPKMNAALYGIKTTELKQLWKDEDENRRKHLLAIYMDLLKKILDEIVDPQVKFTADDENERQCGNCPYYYACR